MKHIASGFVTVLLFFSFILSCTDTKETYYNVVTNIELAGVENNTITVAIGKEFIPTVKLLPEDALGIRQLTSYNWTSSDHSLFTVSEAGVITGVGLGEAVLTVALKNKPHVKASYMVVVNDRTDPVTGIEIADIHKTLVLAPGYTTGLAPLYKVIPVNATYPQVTFTSSNEQVVTIENEIVTATGLGAAVITVTSDDDPSITNTFDIQVKTPGGFTFYDRSGWTVIASHDLPTDNAISNASESLIDGNDNTCFSLVKPGNSYEGIIVGEDETVYFIIDLGEARNINSFSLQHRTSLLYERLRVHTVSIYGSNKPDEGFEIIQSGITVSDGVDGSDAKILWEMGLAVDANYRYIKMTYDAWDTTSGSTMQISEFNAGTVTWQ